MNDLINRETVLNIIANYRIDKYGANKLLWDLIYELPSIQPELLTDKEQRIFLAAMGREEKICKQVDEECRDCKEPYEDSLVRICKEITRKVKGVLWT